MNTLYGSVLSNESIKEYLNRPISERLFISPLLDTDQIGTHSIDLRLGLDFKVPIRSRLPVLDLTISEQEIEKGIRGYQDTARMNLSEPFILHPQQSALASTLEYIRLPKDLMGIINIRSSFSRLGIQINSTMILPLFAGTITLNIVNSGDIPLTLLPGLRIAQMVLHFAQPSNIEASSRYMHATEASHSLIHKDKDLALFGPRLKSTVIGIVSRVGSGRNTVVNYLQNEYGFSRYGMALFVREEANQRGIGNQRPRLQDVGNSMRQLYGNTIIAEKMIRFLKQAVPPNQTVIVDGIKHKAEVEELRKHLNIKILGIDAPKDLRFQRILERNREGDPTTREEFEVVDSRDGGSREGTLEYAQQVDKVFEEADEVISNDTTIPDLHKKTALALKKLLGIDI